MEYILEGNLSTGKLDSSLSRKAEVGELKTHPDSQGLTITNII